MKQVLNRILLPEPYSRGGLMAMEWLMLAYLAFTSLLMAVLWGRLHEPVAMLRMRVGALVLTALLWGLYQWKPCGLVRMLRTAGQMGLLGLWYPDTYEFNRLLPNLDHLFASLEQQVFGFQPALVFHERWSSAVLSELLDMGYVSYYPMIVTVMLFYFLCRYRQFNRTSFIILGAFFSAYVIFIFLPVAGPQFYYEAVGTDLIGQGLFPNIGHYFEWNQASLPIPGYEDGFFYHRLVEAHNAGERPTAAFPSSHVSVTVVLMWLAWASGNRRFFCVLLPFAVLMFFATFYIQAHYAIDALAGLLSGSLTYWLLGKTYDHFNEQMKTGKHR